MRRWQHGSGGWLLPLLPLGGRTRGFFSQWLFDWRLPKIKKEKEIRQDGSALITLDVLETADSFETPYPVRFIFEDGSSRTMVYRIKAGENRLEYIPESPAAVKSIEFNPDYDILEQ